MSATDIGARIAALIGLAEAKHVKVAIYTDGSGYWNVKIDLELEASGPFDRVMDAAMDWLRPR